MGGWIGKAVAAFVVAIAKPIIEAATRAFAAAEAKRIRREMDDIDVEPPRDLDDIGDSVRHHPDD